MLKGIDWKAPEPTEYRASSTVAIGCWVQWETDVRKLDDVGGRSRWRWRLEMNSEVECVEIHGWADDADSAKERVWDALERFVYAFAVDHSEDWPMALSCLLADAESLVGRLKTKGHEIGSPAYNLGHEQFQHTCELARSVLRTVPSDFNLRARPASPKSVSLMTAKEKHDRDLKHPCPTCGAPVRVNCYGLIACASHTARRRLWYTAIEPRD